MALTFTRRRFLTTLSAAAYFVLANAVGCTPLEGAPKIRPLRAPKASPLRFPKVLPLPSVSSPPPGSAWVFRSRPDLSPPGVDVAAPAHDTAPGYVFIAPERGLAGQAGSMILDNRGQVVWSLARLTWTCDEPQDAKLSG